MTVLIFVIGLSLFLAAIFLANVTSRLEETFVELNSSDLTQLSGLSLLGTVLVGGSLLIYLLGFLVEGVAAQANGDDYSLFTRREWVSETKAAILLVFVVIEIMLLGTVAVILGLISQLTGQGRIGSRAGQCLALLVTSLIFVILAFFLLLWLIFLEWLR